MLGGMQGTPIFLFLDNTCGAQGLLVLSLSSEIIPVEVLGLTWDIGDQI